MRFLCIAYVDKAKNIEGIILNRIDSKEEWNIRNKRMACLRLSRSRTRNASYMNSILISNTPQYVKRVRDRIDKTSV